MNSIFILQYPEWLKPEIIPGLPVRWYGLMYVFAFGVAWLLFRYEYKRRAETSFTLDQGSGWVAWAIVGLLLGARLFGTLVYDTSGYYRAHPWLVFWPFDANGTFIGFQGMSFHGGVFGVVVATLIYSKVKRLKWLIIADIIAVCIPLGYTLGRIGNFINGELWGKISLLPWAMVFPNVPETGRFSAREEWVQTFAQNAGIRINSMNELVNLPRHPSPLYEAFFEGIVLWLVLWFFVRKRKSYPGFAVACYLLGYGIIRFVLEYLREPDFGMGYIIQLGQPMPTYVFGGLLNFSMGQLLSLLMIAGAIICFRVFKARSLRTSAAAAAPAPAKSLSKKNRFGAHKG